jgi:hypothetical protein
LIGGMNWPRSAQPGTDAKQSENKKATRQAERLICWSLQ